MTQVQPPDPFAVFGVDHQLDLDMQQLERRYLELSRANHPDQNRAAGIDDCAAVLSRAAEVNDSWRVLKDRWRRAQALIQLRAPEALDEHKQLDPEFLLEAMDLAERVATCEAGSFKAIRAELRQAEDKAFAAIQQAVLDDDFAVAARHLHESKYVRKAQADLTLREEALA